ncbi:MAG: hypothetical protein QOI04_1478 [Verrucomicrobiota bacterium]
MRAFPARQIPDFKTPAAADERDLAFQSDFFAKIIRQNEPALSIGGGVFGAGVEMAQKNSAIACRNSRIVFGQRAHARKFLRRHDEKKLMLGLRKQNKMLRFIITPAGGDGDAVFFVKRMTELTGEEGRGIGIESHVPVDSWSISIHFLPL